MKSQHKHKDDSVYQDCAQLPLRKEHCALLDPHAVFVCLAGLSVGMPVPTEVYISDYTCATIPPWTVIAREEHTLVVVLLLKDANALPIQPTLFDPACVLVIRVLTCPTKTLATEHFLYSLEQPGYGPRRAMLHDLLHEAKLWNKVCAEEAVL